MVRESFTTFLNMVFLELWIIRRIIYVVMIVMVDIIFNYGVAPTKGYHLQSMHNSTTENPNFQKEILNTYFTSVINKTKALEEIIYSDIVINIKSLMKAEYNRATQSIKDSKTEKNGEVKRFNASYGTFVPSYKSDVFLSNTQHSDKEEGSGYVNVNFTAPGFSSFDQDEYLLGLSGNPFATRQPVPALLSLGASVATRSQPQRESNSELLMDPRKKRSVLHLYNMVLCATGCNPFSYKGYGCYCGFLGSGYVVDGIDSCCKMHDWCYNSAGCPMFFEYFIPYLWKCYHRQPLCAIDHGHYGGPRSCAQRLCECDRQLALCLRRFPCPSTKALCTSSPWRLLQNIIML